MALLRSEMASKMASLKQRLEEIREYKRILAEDGLKPDAEDKQLESELIQKLLGLEKDLARMDAAKGRSQGARGEPKGTKEKKSSRAASGNKRSSGGQDKKAAPSTREKAKKDPAKKSRGLLPGVKKDLSKVMPKSQKEDEVGGKKYGARGNKRPVPKAKRPRARP